MRYNEKLQKRLIETGSRLCVGLDPRPDTGGIEAVPEFLKRVVGETKLINLLSGEDFHPAYRAY